jgi:hypothetical protein
VFVFGEYSDEYEEDEIQPHNIEEAEIVYIEKFDNVITETSKQKKQKVQPVISIEHRNLSVLLPNAKNMAIKVFLPSGRKIASKKIVGEKAVITLPKSAKGAIIVTIDADRNYYSQRVLRD